MEFQAPSCTVLDQVSHSDILPMANARSVEIESLLEDPQRLQAGSTLIYSKTRRGTAVTNSAIEIRQAYDSLHRIQAILAYIKIMNIENPGFSSILDEAKHTYDQALSLHDARDFEGSLQLALVSTELSGALGIVISRTLRGDSLYPTLVPMPPEHETTMDDLIHMQEELYRVERRLSLIHRVAENGASLSEGQTQTLRIASCSERLLKKARHLLRCVEMQEAFDLIHAAAATARAAEHVCRRWYATQALDPFLPAQQVRVPCDEPT